MFPLWVLVMVMGIAVGVFLHGLLGVLIVFIGLLILLLGGSREKV